MNCKFGRVLLVVSGSLACLPACALLTKSEPMAPRYFAPELEDTRVEADPSDEKKLDERRLRLGRIEAGLHIRERMVYRTSAEELGYYDDRRWTERPESYLRRALSRSLFEARGITRAVSGAAPTLDAELVAFEELKGPEHHVRVQIVISLDDASRGSLERTITVEREVSGSDEDDPTPVVKALAEALSDAVAQISDQVVQRLASMPPLPPPASPPAGTTSTTLTTMSAPPAPVQR